MEDGTEMLEQVLEKIRSAQTGINFVIEEQAGGGIRQRNKLGDVYLMLGKAHADLEDILKAHAAAR